MVQIFFSETPIRRHRALRIQTVRIPYIGFEPLCLVHSPNERQIRTARTSLPADLVTRRANVVLIHSLAPKLVDALWIGCPHFLEGGLGSFELNLRLPHGGNRLR